MSQQKPVENEKEMTKEVVQNLARIIKDKDLEIDALKQKNETLLAVMHQTSPGKDGKFIFYYLPIKFKEY